MQHKRPVGRASDNPYPPQISLRGFGQTGQIHILNRT
jgi:hypothetical protein